MLSSGVRSLTYRAAFLTFFCLLTCVACSRSSGPVDLVICNGDEPETLDPAIITGQLEGRICLALFEGLTTRNAEGKIIPGMAQSWVISPDNKTYTFTLRPDAKWSNGESVTAYDFLHSWERVLNPATGAQYNYQLFYLVNAQAYAEGKLADFSKVGAKALGDHTLIVTLNNPTPFFLELTSSQTLCPIYFPALKEYPNDWLKPGHLVSNGPYVLKVWRLRDYILLEANPFYWRKVGMPRLKILPTDSPTACFNLFYSHESDLIMDKTSIPTQIVQAIKGEPYFHSNPFGATTFFRFNVKKSPFEDVRVRKALAMAIDKHDIVTKITRAGEPVANSFVPPGSPGYTPVQGLGYHPDQARQLLAAAGYPGGQGFPDVSLLYPKRGSTEQVVTECQAIWQRELGITSIHLRAQEWNVYLQSQSQINYDFCYSSWVGDYNDPETFINMFVTNGGNNDTGWSNSQYDQMLQQANATTDSAVRMQIMHNMEKILVEDEVPIVPIYQYVGISLYRTEKLGGFVPNFVDDHRWGEFYHPENKP